MGLFPPIVSPLQHLDAHTAMQSLTTTSSQGKTDWRIRPEVTDPLIGSEGFRFEAWRKAGLLETIKSGPHRSVYRVSLDVGTFYLKHYRVGDIKAVLQNIVRPVRALREWKAAQQIAALGISTIDTVGVGCTKRHGLILDSYLACKAIENTESLDTFALKRIKDFPTARRREIRRHLADAMGRLVATLHCGGIIHRDLHAENILVRLDPNDTVQLWLIDLHAVSISQRLTLHQIEHNLAMLNPALVHVLTRIDRLRFFRSYWRAVHDQQAGPRHLSKRFETLDRKSVSNRIAAFCRRDLIRIDRKRDRKWADGNRRLIIADTKQIRCRGLAGLGREQLLSIRDNIESLLETTPGQLSDGDVHQRAHSVTVKLGEQSRLCQVQRLELPAMGRLRRLCGAKSVVQRAWELGHACLRRNIPVAKPLAFIEHDVDDRSLQYLLVEQVPKTISLQFVLPRQSRDREVTDNSSTIAAHFAQMLCRLHAAGLDYTPLNVGSILVNTGDSNLPLSFALPTNVRLQKPQPVKTLADLYDSVAQYGNASLTNTIRFLKHYLGERFDGEWKSMWRAVRDQVAASPLPQSSDTSLRKSA